MTHLAQGRACGGCTACCKTHGISDFGKGNGEWCTHCIIGKGCAIYAARPEECEWYKCLWLEGHGDEMDRPDRLKIVMDGDTIDVGPRSVMIWNLWEVERGARLHPRVMQITKALVRQGTVVRHLELRGVNNLFQHFFRPAGMSDTFFLQFKQALREFENNLIPP